MKTKHFILGIIGWGIASIVGIIILIVLACVIIGWYFGIK